MVQLTGQARSELKRQGETEILGQLEQQQTAAQAKDYPKPTAASTHALKTYLDPLFRPFWSGKQLGADEEGAGWDSVQSIRDMRYGRDVTPEEIAKKLKYSKRVRTRLINNEIRRVASLMGLNPVAARVPAAGTSAENSRKAEKQSSFLTKLAITLDEQSPYPLMQRLDDATSEAGLVGVEIFLTGTYDDMVWDTQHNEVDGAEGPETVPETAAQKQTRLTEARRTRRLPFGLRYIDPAALRFEMGDNGIEKVLIVEKKRWRNMVDKYGHKLLASSSGSGPDIGLIDPDRVPQPGDQGTGSLDVMDAKAGVNDVECIRYYDGYWYQYVVAGVEIECEPHGIPFVPVKLGMSRVTSSSDYSEMFQGVAHGLVNLEQAINDWATVEQDKRLTYGRPKPVATTTNMAAIALNEGQPFNVDLSDDSLVILPPGYAIDNAYKDFVATENDGFGQILLSFFQMNGMSPASQGLAPGADTSGYMFNSQQNAGNAPYKGQFDNKARLWREIFDACRLLIRDVISEPVEIADTQSPDGTQTWLSLGPDDIDDTPCEVTIDPLNDQNRMALTAWLMQGMEAGLVRPETVQQRAYGIENTKEENAAIARGMLRKSLMERAVEEAQARVDESVAARQKATTPTILGPNGRPLPPSNMTAGPNSGPPQPEAPMGGPQPPPAPTVGAAAMDAQTAVSPQQAGFTAGQRPIQQGVNPQEAAGVGA